LLLHSIKPAQPLPGRRGSLINPLCVGLQGGVELGLDDLLCVLEVWGKAPSPGLLQRGEELSQGTAQSALSSVELLLFLHALRCPLTPPCCMPWIDLGIVQVLYW